MDPRPVQRPMLVGLKHLSIDEPGLDFPRARDIAQSKAEETLSHPMLLAWFDKYEWKHSPPIC